MAFYFKGSGGVMGVIDTPHWSQFKQFSEYTQPDDFEEDDILFISHIDDIDDKFDKFYKLKNKKVVYFFHEFIHSHVREHYLERYENVYFLDPHLDLITTNNDLPLILRIFGFVSVFTETEKNREFLNNNFKLERTKKLNFFNRTINVRRAKAFEILLKNNVKFGNDVYHTMGLHLNKFNFPMFDTNTEYLIGKVEASPSFKNINIDYNFLEQNENKLSLIEGHRYHDKHPSVQDKWEDGFFNQISQMSIDSYISFIIESSNDTGIDCRITEKTLRSFLFKNIFLVIAAPGFNRGLKEGGIKLFNDVFGLDDDWDECDEIDRVNIFTTKLIEFNNKSIEEIREIYLNKDIQNRLEHNFNFVLKAFEDFYPMLQNHFYEDFILK